jgi:hypothetical protein
MCGAAEPVGLGATEERGRGELREINVQSERCQRGEGEQSEAAGALIKGPIDNGIWVMPSRRRPETAQIMNLL